MHPPDDAAALRALQDAIYREKILRARILTPEQRLADAFELTNGVFARRLWPHRTTISVKGHT